MTKVKGLPAGESSPVFSPGGSQFAFRALQPAWSPDSTQLAVLTNGQLEVDVVNADGTGEKVLTTAATGYGYSAPDWWGSATSRVASRA